MARADCPLCNGSGWKTVERPNEIVETSERTVSNPEAVSKPVWAVPCDCTFGDRADRALAKARVPERYRNRDFENFDVDIEFDNFPSAQAETFRRSLVQAKLTVQRFAEEFPVGLEDGLLLMGPCGVGKTHLAVAALKAIIDRGHVGLFYEYANLLKEIQASYSPENPSTEMGILEPVFKTELLVLDDVGSSKPSLWALEMVGHILNTRYSDKRLTIITTNYLDSEFAQQKPGDSVRLRGKDAPPPDPSKSLSVVRLPSGELVSSYREDSLEERVGRRIRSRLYEMCRTVHVRAPDFRKEVRDVTKFDRG